MTNRIKAERVKRKQHISELATPRRVTQKYSGPPPQQPLVSPAALRYIASPRINDLSRPQGSSRRRISVTNQLSSDARSEEIIRRALEIHSTE